MSKSSIEGFDSWSNWIDSLDDKIKRETLELVETTALKIESEAKWNVPVDTGRLEGSIKTEVDRSKVSAEVFTDVEYALPVELGSSTQGAQPYMIPAFNKHSKGFENKVRDIATREMN